MSPQLGQQAITTQILPNISKSQGNQTMKFGHLIEYNMRNIFLERSYTKCGGEPSPRPFYKKSKRNSESLKYSLFLLYVQLKVYQNVLKLKC